MSYFVAGRATGIRTQKRRVGRMCFSWGEHRGAYSLWIPLRSRETATVQVTNQTEIIPNNDDKKIKKKIK